MSIMILTEQMLKFVNDALEKAAELLKDHPEEKQRIMLEANFGECVYADNFSFRETVSWIKKRGDLLKGGAKAMVFKIDDEQFISMFGKHSKVQLMGDTYLAITIIGDNVDDEAPKSENNLLVKYETLDEKLENVLANGEWVVEG